MLKVGITGGIGSGKSTICRLFELLGIPVYYADDRAKWLIQNDPTLKTNIVKHFGNSSFTNEGIYNRAYMADIVFNAADKLALLNALVHPVVKQDSQNWLARNASYQYVIKEAALLFESGSYRQLDRTLFVYAPRELRIKRVMERDGVSREVVESRMNAQWPDDKKKSLANDIIYNDGSQSIILQVLKFHRLYSSVRNNE